MSPEKMFVNNGETTVDGLPIRNASQGIVFAGRPNVADGVHYLLNTDQRRCCGGWVGSETDINAQGWRDCAIIIDNHFGLGQATGIELIEATRLLYAPEQVEYGWRRLMRI